MKSTTSILRLLAACTLTSFTALAQVDNFNDGNDNGWVRTDPIREALEFVTGQPMPPFAHWSFPDGGYRIQSDPSPDAGALGPSRAASYWTNAAYTYTNFYASVEIRPWGTNVDQAVGLLGRLQSYSQYGQTYAYTLTYEPNVSDFQITRFEGGAFTPLAAVKATLSPTNSHRMVFTGVGDVLEGRIYVLPDVVNPVAIVTVTDSSDLHFTEGWCGVLVFSIRNVATDATYDNYAALPAPPPSLSVARVASEVWVSWPVGPINYTLQSSGALPAATWGSITTGITQSGGQNTYKATPSGKTFYRLVTN
jgi:hypothetical protein